MPENAPPAPKRTQRQRILRDAGQAALQGTALKFGAGTVMTRCAAGSSPGLDRGAERLCLRRGRSGRPARGLAMHECRKPAIFRRPSAT